MSFETSGQTPAQKIKLPKIHATMNHQVSDALLHKESKNAYRTRYLLQSGGAKSKRFNCTPRLIQQLGGMGMLDFMAITISELLQRETQLHLVYGDMDLQTLIPIEKELLLYTFGVAHGRKAPILQKICQLGLMDHCGFDCFLVLHLEIMYDCIEEERALLECANKFAALRPLLEQIQSQRQQKRTSGRENQISRLSINSSTLNTIAEDCLLAAALESEEEEEAVCGDEMNHCRAKNSKRVRRPSFLKKQSSRVLAFLGGNNKDDVC